MVAAICHDKELDGAAARFWAEAFQARPSLAEDRQAHHRFNAACDAALAGCDQGKDDPPLDDAARARWRRQSIDWLRAELAGWARILEGGPTRARAAVSPMLQHWKLDSALAGLREPAEVAKLSEAEQKACRSLWAEVDALLQKTRGARP